MTPIDPSEPFSPLNHVHPEPIVEEEVRIHVPPPPIMNDRLVIWFPRLPDPVEGVLGNLSISLSVSIKKKQRGKLPHKSKGSDQSLTMGYVPSHPNNGYTQGANRWLTQW